MYSIRVKHSANLAKDVNIVYFLFASFVDSASDIIDLEHMNLSNDRYFERKFEKCKERSYHFTENVMAAHK